MCPRRRVRSSGPTTSGSPRRSAGTSAARAGRGVRPRVIDSGHGWNGSREGVRLALDGPAWLVLAESWSKGWRAYCTDRDGEETDLGEPEPIDGFASGWSAPASCTTARFAFAPQRMATVAYLLSLVAAALMLIFLLVTVVRRTAPGPAVRAPAELPDGDRLVRLGWGWAIAAGLAVGLAGGFLFALRAGVVLAPAHSRSRFAWASSVQAGCSSPRPSASARCPSSTSSSPRAIAAATSSAIPTISSGRTGWRCSPCCACWPPGCCSRRGSGQLPHPDHAVPHQHLANERDPRDEPEPRPVARLDPLDRHLRQAAHEAQHRPDVHGP